MFVIILGADWEPSHEELAYISFGGHVYTAGGEEDFDFDDVLGMQEVSFCVIILCTGFGGGC